MIAAGTDCPLLVFAAACTRPRAPPVAAPLARECLCLTAALPRMRSLGKHPTGFQTIQVGKVCKQEAGAGLARATARQDADA